MSYTFKVVTGKEKYKVVDNSNGGEAYFNDKREAYVHMAILHTLGRTYTLVVDGTRGATKQ